MIPFETLCLRFSASPCGIFFRHIKASPPQAVGPRRWRGPTAAVLVPLACLAACAARRPAPPPPLAAVTVLPVADIPERAATTGIFTFYSWIAEIRAAVPGQLATALRDRLAARGITALAADGPAPPTLHQAIQAVSAAHPESPALYVVLGKWEAENVTSPQYVDVSLDATLIAPGGKILWTSRRQSGPIATLNAIDLASAYRMAIEDVAERLVGNWHAEAADGVRTKD